ncbi:hypothetical protein THAOC_20889 [Thalassiosira oceanica]|uniref:DUF7733 domain-containing protein n=1 Tax=Thalassiosira oceanica TaxID=159749 RepID=K0RYS3_THAOC|nr:hypothetical protein THAOC_20889 [Thalassiosira oceanica]|eukprot:EJK58948.1 hypothetical protein THAOC_20889 [Thalassiosira oceanica]
MMFQFATTRFVVSVALLIVDALVAGLQTGRTTYVTSTRSSLRASAYGKGSEIFPECNAEPIKLSASFPNGVLPPPVQTMLEKSGESSPDEAIGEESIEETPSLGSPTSRDVTIGKRRAVKRTLKHILESAATSSETRARSSGERDFTQRVPRVEKMPFVLAIALLASKCVNVGVVLASIGLSVYFIGLASWCAAPAKASTAANMPSLPRNGHVPNLIANPLGYAMTGSKRYRRWLRLGAVIGLLLPLAMLIELSIDSSGAWLSLPSGCSVSRVRMLLGCPVFLLCTQALTEAVARIALLPLPLRILIPVSYNLMRLSTIHCWAFPANPIPRTIQALGVTNLIYWYANLLFFLVPVGVVRYMRAHFFAVEATEVTLSRGTSIDRIS